MNYRPLLIALVVTACSGASPSSKVIYPPEVKEEASGNTLVQEAVTNWFANPPSIQPKLDKTETFLMGQNRWTANYQDITIVFGPDETDQQPNLRDVRGCYFLVIPDIESRQQALCDALMAAGRKYRRECGIEIPFPSDPRILEQNLLK